MDIRDMIRRKKELGYTNRDIAELSGVPLGTVQKIFSGSTKSPHLQTLIMLEELLKKERQDVRSVRVPVPGTPYEYIPRSEEVLMHEKVLAYNGAKQETLPQGPRKQGYYTVDDYFAMPEERRVELIDGIIYDMSAPGRLHQALVLEISTRLLMFQKESGRDCEVLISPIDVQLDENDRTMVQPDIAVVCHEDHNRRVIWGAPEFVLEVLSPASRSRDCFLKLNKYRDAGCKEYWIVDGENQRVFVYEFSREDPEDADSTVNIPIPYTFEDKIPVRISAGEMIIDFAEIREDLKRYYK